jgi:hypothetical protein
MALLFRRDAAWVGKEAIAASGGSGAFTFRNGGETARRRPGRDGRAAGYGSVACQVTRPKSAELSFAVRASSSQGNRLTLQSRGAITAITGGTFRSNPSL